MASQEQRICVSNKKRSVSAGAMPMGGLAELKRRKQEKERAERGDTSAGAAAEEESKPSEPAEAQQQPGELKHVSVRARIF